MTSDDVKALLTSAIPGAPCCEIADLQFLAETKEGTTTYVSIYRAFDKGVLRSAPKSDVLLEFTDDKMKKEVLNVVFKALDVAPDKTVRMLIKRHISRRLSPDTMHEAIRREARDYVQGNTHELVYEIDRRLNMPGLVNDVWNGSCPFGAGQETVHERLFSIGQLVSTNYKLGTSDYGSPVLVKFKLQDIGWAAAAKKARTADE